MAINKWPSTNHPEHHKKVGLPQKDSIQVQVFSTPKSAMKLTTKMGGWGVGDCGGRFTCLPQRPLQIRRPRA